MSNQLNSHETSFFDPKTILAILITVGVIFGWQTYLSKKYPPSNNIEAESKQTEATANTKAVETKPDTKSKLEKEAASAATTKNSTETLADYSSENINFKISSYGMGIKNVELNNYTDRKGEKIRIGNDLSKEYLFEFKANIPGLDRIPFDIKQAGQNEYIGTFKKDKTEVVRKYTVHPEVYSIDVETKLTNFSYENEVLIPEKVIPQEGGGSFLMPAYENQSVFVAHSNTTDRAIIRPSKLENPFKDEFSTVNLASIGSLYFVSALIDESPISPFFKTKLQKSGDSDEITGLVKYALPEGNKENTTKYKIYIGPKDIKMLEKVDERLSGTVNFGWFGFISKPLLGLMKIFYGLFHNYGVAIILLTLTVRLILLPINVSSYRSMKKMQQIQPLMKEIKEKYKDDPKKLNEETMRVFSQNKVNPFGGCLPMLLQFPVFISLYSLLGHSIELYKAPFGLWIHDLSFKDPFYILPVLMGVSMFIQQKITPSTMDPAQQKILMFMPVFFSFLMIGLPSGLTLYIFVSTLFGIMQQFVFLNDKKNQLKQASS